ncbi:nucleotidyl transferase AbiEii/AbiGii toxin family protein [Treponema sp. OMZ 840]|uniref:nucleotidyl transferase AbiEii/AbiGii toxin family protein n=1 Tax=Treponema sp. OMZ 840 TaxID=244313 RepID=UPI003D8C4DB6
MEKDIIRDYTQLYALQDKVLKIIFSEATSFYLTGGTALHRFYCERRYSDDLDLFMQGQPYFYDETKAAIYKLKEKFTVEAIVNAKDFLRVQIENLKIDFVNDRVYRYGMSNIKDGIAVDNVYNILANKLTAVLGRDEEKDVFDIVSICLMYDFNWANVLEAAHEKEGFGDYVLIERLKSFPLEWLENLKLIKKTDITDKMIDIMCSDIKGKKRNSLIRENKI